MDEKNDNDNEIVPEHDPSVDEVELSDEEATYENKLTALRKKLKQCEAERTQHLDELQRAKAEFLNAKKRQEDSLKKAREDIRNEFVSSLLPLCDSFDMAMSDTHAWEQIDATWRTGVESIHTQLQSILYAHNVVPIDPRGEPFDPAYHEAVSTTESEQEADTVVDVIQKGYTRNGDVIRPAKVILSS